MSLRSISWPFFFFFFSQLLERFNGKIIISVCFKNVNCLYFNAIIASPFFLEQNDVMSKNLMNCHINVNENSLRIFGKYYFIFNFSLT